jgi:hypothetical protein
MQKLMKKDFFLATDAAIKSSNKEENEQENFFLFNCKMKKQRENADKHKTKKTK